jgi:hypothetical protein
MIMVSSRSHQKLSSNGFDLVELEPKPVDHRQNRIYPVLEIYRPEDRDTGSIHSKKEQL